MKSLRHKTDKQESLLAIVFSISMRDSQVISNLQEVTYSSSLCSIFHKKEKAFLFFFIPFF